MTYSIVILNKFKYGVLYALRKCYMDYFSINFMQYCNVFSFMNKYRKTVHRSRFVEYGLPHFRCSIENTLLAPSKPNLVGKLLLINSLAFISPPILYAPDAYKCTSKCK